MSRVLNTIKKFIINNKILCFVIVLLLSFSIYLLASANEDVYANQIEITGARVLGIIDGTPNEDGNFDPNDEKGNDSSNTNKIVRNFDLISYDFSYNLSYKENSSLDEEDKTLSTTRNVLIDVLVPATLSCDVSSDNTSVTADKQGNVTLDGIDYKYYIIEQSERDVSQNYSTSVILSNINSTNGTQIKPIIRVREETDEDVTEIKDNVSLSEIKSLNVEPVTVTAKAANYNVKLYKSNVEKKKTITTIPVGMMVYVTPDSNRGIRGLEMPQDYNFNLSVSTPTTTDSTILTDENPKIVNNDGTYSIDELPISDNNNGKSGVTVTSTNGSNGIFNIDFKSLKFNIDKVLSDSTYYLSTKVFVFKTQRNTKNDITYTINTNNDNAITVVDNYDPYAGEYSTKIDFINENEIVGTSEPKLTEQGKAIYNYNEDFYIQDTITYATKEGDTLKNGFTNYIKVDSTAMKLEDVGNVSDESLDYYIEIIKENNLVNKDYDYSVQYGIGEWNSSYFVKKENAPTYCPSNLNSLSKEQLMNLYGGPCIEENSNLKWFDSIEDAASADKNNRNKIIIFKLDVKSAYDPKVKTIVRLKAKTVKNYSNIGNTFQIVSRAKTNWNGTDYYLSDTPGVSISQMTSDISYEKSTYNQSTKEIVVNDTSDFGNSILVSPFKASINPIVVSDSYSGTSAKPMIYSGMTDPMEITINPVIYKSDFDSTITSATLLVYLPSNLEIYQRAGDREYTSVNKVTINNVEYNEYTYTYSEDEIKYENESASGTIPNLKIHAYIAINTPDNTEAKIFARISGQLKTNVDATTTYTDVTSNEQRTTETSIVLRNIREVNNNGRTNVVYIDENGTYEYNMRATNLSKSDANLEMLYILPYSGDGVGEGSDFEGNISASIKNQLPSGYVAYYTKSNSKTILNNELNSTNDWIKWDNYSAPIAGVTAIKIMAPSSIRNTDYFAGVDGVTVSLNTNGNNESEKYFNHFYMIQRGALVCKDIDIESEEEELNCSKEEKNVSYVSNISSVSVYNRTISGMVFEDSNYNGLSDNDESKLSDIIVELYNLSSTNFEASKPINSISDEDKIISDTVTNNKGTYKFDGLSSGNYYLKYTFDCNKYTITEKNKQDPTVEGDTSLKDSDADIVEKESEENDKNVCYAVSNIITLNNNSVEVKNIDLGLRVRQNFDIKMKKYITKVVVNSNKGTQTYEYNNQSKVKIDVKNLKNTSFRVTYSIQIENSKYFPGTIGNIIETIPEGMTFDSSLAENDGWIESNGNLYYSYLNKTLIMPGEKYHLSIVFDLKTDSGGDYINFVAANDLKIMPILTNFIEAPEFTSEEQTNDEQTELDSEVDE